MPALDPITNPVRLNVTLGTSPTTRAGMSAEQIRHTEPIPGEANNTSNDWRQHHSDGLSANQEAIRQALARLDTLGNFLDEDGFVSASADQAAAGYAYEARDGQVGSNQSLAVVAGNQVTTIASAPSSGIVLYIRVPAGIDPATVRMDHRRSNTLVQSYPRPEDDWDRTTAFTGRSPHYDYYRLVDDDSGSTISISGVQAGDTFLMRIHGHDSAVAPVQTIEVISDDQNSLPDVEEHPDTKLILWRGQFYRKRQVSDGDYAFSFRSGKRRNERGSVFYGISSGVFGQFIVNPSDRFSGMYHQQGRGHELFVQRSAYRTAKGSNEAIGDALTVILVTDEDTPRTSTLNLTYQGNSFQDDSVTYLEFGGGGATILDAASTGFDIEVTLQRGGSNFLVAGATHVAWVVVDLVQTQLNAQAIQDLRDRLDVEEHHSEALRTEVHTLEDKTSRIELDRETSPWAATTDNEDGLRLGKAFFQPDATADTFYLNGLHWNLRTVATSLTIDGAEYDNSLLGFIASNNSTWRNVRVVIRNRDGQVVASYSPQNGRTAPSDLAEPPAEVPAELGDYTVRYLTNSDGSPAVIPVIGFDYTITVEERADDEIPVWAGDISDALRERVAANEAQLASVNQQLRNDIANPVFRDILEIDDNSDWDGSSERFRVFSHTIADVKDGDFVEIDWLNFNTTSDIFRHFAIHGSTETQGRFLFHGRDLTQRTSVRPNTAEGGSTSRENGFIGVSTGTIRRQVGENLVDDSGGAILRWFLYRVGTTVHLDACASIVSNPQGMGKMPEGFYLRSRTWRESAQVQSTRLLPDRPDAVEDRRGLVPKFDGEGNMVYAQPIGPVQQLAFRSRITGDWTLGAPTGELTVTDLGFSGTTLRINARKALRSKSYGVVVTVSRGTDEISRVVIPWALFRTGSGTYITGGGHGTQGVPVGYWSDAANAYLVATCDWDFDNDRFELTVQGGTTDTNSILRVHLAR